MSLPQNEQQGKTNIAMEHNCSSATRCCVITGEGRSAVAVVAIDGPEALEIVSRCFHPASAIQLEAGQIRYGSWVGPDASETVGESIVVTPISAYAVEVHCHGGSAATARIVADMQDCGATDLDPMDWSLDHSSPLIREAREVLTWCLTPRTAAIALDQVRGAMLSWAVKRAGELRTGEADTKGVCDDAGQMLRLVPLGLRLAEPFRIVLIGPPNVGKSSLLNAIVGYDRSITFNEAGTTRDVLHADTVIDGWPVQLSDTAGIRQSDDPIEVEGVVRAQAAADLADLILLVSEPTWMLTAGSTDSISDSEPIATKISEREDLPIIRLLNKSDLLRQGSATDDRTHASMDLSSFDLQTNALDGEGIDRLIEMIASRLGGLLPEPGDAVPVSSRQADLLAEIADASSTLGVKTALHELIGTDTVP